jgi:hypothetical protein
MKQATPITPSINGGPALRRRTPRFPLHVCGLAVLLLLAPSSWAADTTPAPLSQVLDRVGKQVATFLDQFGQVTCTEVVVQESLRPNGKLDFKEQTTFDLLTMVDVSGDDVALDESRLPQQPQSQRQPSRPSKNPSLLVTNGFSTFLLVFHPSYQQAFEFSQMADDVESGKHLLHIQFRHIKGMRSPTALVLSDRAYPLDLQGTAWIDPDSGMITRIEAELGSNLDDLGLRVFRTEVQYAPVNVKGGALWLPASATIVVQTPRQHWRNVHSFANYKRFSVSTEAKANQ